MCKYIYLFFYYFLFFNKMLYIFVNVIKKILEYEKANYTFLCLFVNWHKSGDSSGCTSDRLDSFFGR